MWAEAPESGYQVVSWPSPIDNAAREKDSGVEPVLEGNRGH